MEKQEVKLKKSNFDTLHLRIDKNIKKEAQETLDGIGITLHHAIKIFLSQIIIQGGIPYKGFVNTSSRVTTAHDKKKMRSDAHDQITNLYANLAEIEYKRTGKLNPKFFDKLLKS